eukprot:gene9421-10407_t
MAEDQEQLADEEVRLVQEEATMNKQELEMTQIETKMHEKGTSPANEEVKKAHEKAKMAQQEAKLAQEQATITQEKEIATHESIKIAKEKENIAHEEANLLQEEATTGQEQIKLAQEEATTTQEKMNVVQEEMKTLENLGQIKQSILAQEQFEMDQEQARKAIEQAQRAEEEIETYKRKIELLNAELAQTSENDLALVEKEIELMELEKILEERMQEIEILQMSFGEVNKEGVQLCNKELSSVDKVAKTHLQQIDENNTEIEGQKKEIEKQVKHIKRWQRENQEEVVNEKILMERTSSLESNQQNEKIICIEPMESDNDNGSISNKTSSSSTELVEDNTLAERLEMEPFSYRENAKEICLETASEAGKNVDDDMRQLPIVEKEDEIEFNEAEALQDPKVLSLLGSGRELFGGKRKQKESEIIKEMRKAQKKENKKILKQARVNNLKSSLSRPASCERNFMISPMEKTVELKAPFSQHKALPSIQNTKKNED